MLCPLHGSTQKAFGLISSIFCYQEKIIFACEMYRTLQVDSHFQAFRIEKKIQSFS